VDVKDWKAAAKGSFAVMRSGGRFSKNVWAGRYKRRREIGPWPSNFGNQAVGLATRQRGGWWASFLQQRQSLRTSKLEFRKLRRLDIPYFAAL
jgi:hypothetical protein